jgi:hypothetical protein
MLSNIYREHIERVSYLKQKQGYLNNFLSKFRNSFDWLIEKKKKELLSSVDQLTHAILDRLNDE